MTPTEARDYAHRLAAEDFAAALRVASQISEPWFKAQALACVGRYAPEDQAVSIIRESLVVATSCSDEYKRVCVAASPLRALIERRQDSLVLDILPDLLQGGLSIESASSRSQALFMLFQAVLPGEQTVWQRALEALVSASVPIEHWRQRRNLRDAICMVAHRSPELAGQIISAIDDNKTKQQVERALRLGISAEPRRFFWRQ